MKLSILALLLLLPFASADCVDFIGETINSSLTLCGDTFDVPSGVTITGNDLVVDCNSAILRGISDKSEIGVRIEHSDNVTLRNCNILTFNQGLYLKNVTNSLIEDNALLKNNIGIRMLDSFENTIRKNSDKSHKRAVSAINSKYNTVILGNKNVERWFCEVNACNEIREMNVCEDDDLYCSKKCTPEADNDCGTLEVKKEVKDEKSVDEFVEEKRKEIEERQEGVETIMEESVEGEELSFLAKLLIYVGLYISTFIVLRILKKGD